MGWFWADNDTSRRTAAAEPPTLFEQQHSQNAPRKSLGRNERPPHPMPMGNMEPPPECPMHKPSSSATPVTRPEASGCPYKPSDSKAAASPPPLLRASTTAVSSQPPPPSTQPATSTPQGDSWTSKLNPLNYMPSVISNKRESEHQTHILPLSREPSSIPRGDGSGNWEYPSPQQMYNAMLRKGYTDTPAEHVESMVAVHNFLNEGAWEEIREWERRFADGLGKGWEYSKHGEERGSRMAALDELRAKMRKDKDAEDREPKLMRFMGRPREPTPKARMLGFMAWLYPSMFPDNPPFDRHDWYVQRQLPGGGTREVRYVIDYYSGPPEPTGEPVFYLDVRPAVDGPTAACERMLRWGGDVWYRASGGSVREEVEKARR